MILRLLPLLVLAPASGPRVQDPSPPASRPAPAVVVRLLDAGDAPRRRLRCGPEAGATQRLRITTRMGGKLWVGGVEQTSRPIPASRMTVGVEVARVAETGRVDAAWCVEEAGLVEPLPPSPPGETVKDAKERMALVEASRAALARLPGLRIEATTSSRGILAVAPRVLAAGSGARDAATQESVRIALEQLLVQLPEEEIGVGGRFEVSAWLTVEGMRVEQVQTLRVTELTETSVRLDLELVRRAEPMEVAGVGGKPSLVSYSARGRGSFRLDPRCVFPVEAIVVLDSHSFRPAPPGTSEKGYQMQAAVETKLETP